MSPAAAAVYLHQLSKSFRVGRPRGTGVGSRVRDVFHRETQTITAVDKLSFSIAPGERVAFIGPNGAGKSTTLKMLAGILQPDGGDVHVLGFVPSRQRRRLAFLIGTVFGQRSQLWYQLPPRDTFELLGRVYDIEPREHRRRVEMLCSAFALGALVNTRFATSRSARGCAAKSSRACCTRRACCFSTSRRSASTCQRRR